MIDERKGPSQLGRVVEVIRFGVYKNRPGHLM